MTARTTALLGLAACLLHGSAAAATVEGAVTFPGRMVTAARIYARNLETGALHEATLRRGEREFRMDLPAGRYWLFIRPLEAGLVELYGGRTRFSACRANNAVAPAGRTAPPGAKHEETAEAPSPSDCNDHSLLDIDVPATGSLTALAIDDWLLDEAQAQELDRILGASVESEDSAELGRPRFSEYRVAPSGPLTAAPPKLDGDPRAPSMASALAAAAAHGANFAGGYSLARVPCGDGCEQIAILDVAQGNIHFPEFLARIASAPPCRADQSLDYREDSRLLEYTHADGETVITDYLLWDLDRKAFTALAQYRRSTQRFCEGAAADGTTVSGAVIPPRTSDRRFAPG